MKLAPIIRSISEKVERERKRKNRIVIETMKRGNGAEKGLSKNDTGVYREFLQVVQVPPFKIRLGARVYLTSGKSTYESKRSSGATVEGR